MKLRMIVLILVVLGGLSPRRGLAQELNCQVTVNFNQANSAQVTDRQIFPQMQAFITDFMNNRRWTSDAFNPEERINCKLVIDILKVPAQNYYEGRAQVIVTRPVYGSNYETVTLRYIDNAFNFPYRQSDPMYFNENSYQNELTSLLAFHALIMLGVDYDSFSKQGGKLFFQRAYNVMSLANQSAVGGGAWGAQGDIRNRYWLIENLQSQQFVPYHEALYTYHRQALDNFTANPAGSRQQVLEVLGAIRQVSQQRPNSVVINTFFDAKGEELFNIMNEGSREDRQKAFTLLSTLDPAKTEVYRKLLR
ncbi:type IX secretion system protein PorD [Larkinella insperata]|uniref:type IX secretion system protein PorD n=1 Tax=Larkinella insperata TaxID=332158 RepID=UPI00404466D3